MNTPSDFINTKGIPNTIPSPERVLQDTKRAHHHLQQIEYHLGQTLYPAHLSMDLIKGDGETYSIRYKVSIPETKSVLIEVNQVVNAGTAYYILGSLDRILDLPLPEPISAMGSICIARHYDGVSNAYTIVSPSYRISYTKHADDPQTVGMVRVDSDALEDDSALEILDEVATDRNAKKTIEDDGVIVYTFESDKFSEVIRLENKSTLKKRFSEELKDRYEANIAAL